MFLVSLKTNGFSSAYQIIFRHLPSHSEKPTLWGIHYLFFKKSPGIFFITPTLVCQVEEKIMRIILCFYNLLLSKLYL